MKEKRKVSQEAAERSRWSGRRHAENQAEGVFREELGRDTFVKTGEQQHSDT